MLIRLICLLSFIGLWGPVASQNCTDPGSPISVDPSKNLENLDGPIIIDQGGTYCGRWSSNDACIPVIEIATDECVIIENSVLYGVGNIIWINNNSPCSNVTIRNCYVFGVDPSLPEFWGAWDVGSCNQGYPAGYGNGSFVRINTVPQYLEIHNNYIERTLGILVHDHQINDTTITNPQTCSDVPEIKVYNNIFKNMDGRLIHSDGKMSVISGSANPCNVNGKPDPVCFVPNRRWAFGIQLRNIPFPIDAEISWNQFINKPNESFIEDNINLFNVQGTDNDPILVHNNFIWGAYPPGPINDPQKPFDAYDVIHYSGSGIQCGDGCAYGRSDQLAKGYDMRHVKVFENQVIGSSHYGIGVVGARDIEIYENTILSSGQGPELLDPQDPNSFRDIEQQNAPFKKLHSRGIFTMPYQPLLNWGCEDAYTMFNDHCGPGAIGGTGFMKDGTGTGWRESFNFTNVDVHDNVIWWRRRDFVPSFVPGMWDGPPNNTPGFYSVNNWTWKDLNPGGPPWAKDCPNSPPPAAGDDPANPLDPDDPLWHSNYQVVGATLTTVQVVNEFKTDPISYWDERAEFEIWKTKVAERYVQTGEVLGPQKTIVYNSSVVPVVFSGSTSQIYDYIEISGGATYLATSPAEVIASRKISVLGSPSIVSSPKLVGNVRYRIDQVELTSSEINNYPSHCDQGQGERISSEELQTNASLDQMNDQLLVSVFPNPSNGSVSIRANEFIKKIDIVSLEGVIVDSHMVLADEYELSCERRGTLILKIHLLEEVVMKRLIID